MDYKRIFEQTPFSLIIFEPKFPYIILKATEDYFKTIGKAEGRIIGKTLDEVFPEGENGWNTEARNYLIKSFEFVTKEKRRDKMAIVRYDVSTPNGFEPTYWSPENHPILDSKGNILYIMHVARDITPIMKHVYKEKSPD